jgi:hypothetical protein
MVVTPNPMPPLVLRPHEILCMICHDREPVGAEGLPRLRGYLAAIRESPDRPVTLRCNAGDVYVYQDPGTDRDTPESPEYNRKRDLDILQRLDLAPGSTLPARTLLHRVLNTITTLRGLCAYEATTADAWRGCARADAGQYEQTRGQGIDALIPPRDEAEMAREKERSLSAMYEAEAIPIRPHILICAVCQFGGGVRPPFAPDNLPELIELVRRKPDTRLRLAQGADWMMCAPCPKRVPALNACVNVAGSGGLSNEKRDLDLLQTLGLQYGATMPARDLLLLLFEKVPTTMGICARDNAPPSVWWDGCGETNRTKGNEGYERGREALAAEFRAR